MINQKIVELKKQELQTNITENKKVRTLDINKPPVQPRFSLRGELQEKYSRLVDGRLRSIERIFEKKFITEGVLDDQEIAKCIFDEKETKIKHSSSLLDISSSVDFTNTEKFHKKSSKHKLTTEDDIKTLNKLSMMNMGARYELLHANRMMVDLDLKLVRI